MPIRGNERPNIGSVPLIACLIDVNVQLLFKFCNSCHSVLQEGVADGHDSGQQSPSDEDIDIAATPVVTDDKKDKKKKEKKEKVKKEKPPKEKKEKPPKEKKEKPPKEPKPPKPQKQPKQPVRSSRMVLCRVQLLDNSDVEVEVDVSIPRCLSL